MDLIDSAALDPEATQTMLSKASRGDLWHWQGIDLEQAIALAESRGAGVRIGVIDSGVEYTHPELRHNYGGGMEPTYHGEVPFVQWAR